MARILLKRFLSEMQRQPTSIEKKIFAGFGFAFGRVHSGQRGDLI